MGVQAQINADRQHFLAHQKHFGRALQGRLQPLAVQVGTGGIGAQVATRAAVGVHVGHHIKHAALQQDTAHRIIGIQQALQKAFGKPLGHGLAGVLAGDQPDLFTLGLGHGGRCIGDTQHRHIPPIQRAAQAGLGDMAGGASRAQQIQMLLIRIRLKVGQVDALGLWRQPRRHHLAIKLRVDAKPVLPVVTGHHLVAVPAIRVGALARIHKTHHHRHLRRTVQRKMKPLGKIRSIVLADVDLNIARIGHANHVNGTGIELGGNRDLRHSGHCRSGRLRRFVRLSLPATLPIDKHGTCHSRSFL